MSSDLRELIAQSQPSVVLSRARASLLSPSRPNTPLLATRSFADSPEWEASAAFAGSRKSNLLGGKRVSTTTINTKLSEYSALTPAETRADIQSGENESASKPSNRACNAQRPDVDASAVEQKTFSSHPRGSSYSTSSGTLIEDTGRNALASLKKSVNDMKQNAYPPPLDTWDQLSQVCALARTSSQAKALVMLSVEEILPTILGCVSSQDLPESARLCAARMIACACEIPSFVEYFVNYVEEMARIVCALALEATQDDLFRTSQLLESLVQFVVPACADRVRDDEQAAQTLRFVACTMKNICSENEENRAALAQYGSISLLSKVIQIAGAALEDHQLHSEPEGKFGCKETSKNPSSIDTLCQVITEATAILRCLVDDKRRLPQFTSSKVAAGLCKCLQNNLSSDALILNCSRVLSRLSMSKRARETIDVGSLVYALADIYTTQLPASIRLCFALGNLTTDTPGARTQVASALDHGGLMAIVRIFDYHTKLYLKITHETSTSKAKREQKECEDLLIKIVRLVANLSIEEPLGKRLIVDCKVNRAVVTLLQALLRDHTQELSVKQEELALNLVACATNLSYYSTIVNASELKTLPLFGKDMIRSFIPFLFAENAEAVHEAVRAFANFSRLEIMREVMLECRACEAIILLLGHSDREVVLSACGALTNLVADNQVCELLEGLDGASTLVGRLRQGGVSDPELSLRCAMVLYNIGRCNPKTIQLQQKRLLETLEQLVEVARELAFEAQVLKEVGSYGRANREGKHQDDEFLLEFAEVGGNLHALCKSF